MTGHLDLLVHAALAVVALTVIGAQGLTSKRDVPLRWWWLLVLGLAATFSVFTLPVTSSLRLIGAPFAIAETTRIGDDWYMHSTPYGLVSPFANVLFWRAAIALARRSFSGRRGHLQ